jgi:DNA-binding Lrp family transcriptional regulator
MEEQVCKASMEKIAARIGVSVNTARRHTQKLVEAGYLEDLTPDRRYAPHIYRDTGKVVIEAELRARKADEVTQSGQPSNEGYPERETEVSQSGQPRLPREGNKETLLRDSHEDTTASKGPLGPGSLPHNLEEWFVFVKAGDGKPGGKTARLGRMAQTLYPDFEPDYGRIGKAIKQVGGARRLVHLLWHSQVYRVTGSPIDYAVAMHTKGNGRGSNLEGTFEALRRFQEGS